jgi:D-3-phosphoglycerate dehydrogenase
LKITGLEFKKFFTGVRIKTTILFLEKCSLDKPELISLLKQFNIHFMHESGLKILNKSSVTHLYTRIYQKLDSKFLRMFSNLRVILCPTTSLDHIDYAYCKDHNIKIISLSGETEFLQEVTSTAELTAWFILELARMPSKYRQIVSNGSWDRYEYRTESLSGKTLGIIGLGRVGSQVASIFHNLNMNIIFYDTNNNISTSYRRVSKLEKIAEQSDFISIHVSGVSLNKNLIGRNFFSKLNSKGAYLINTSRGFIINEPDLLNSIRNGNILGFAADVLVDEEGSGDLWLGKNLIWQEMKLNHKIIITPHIGGSTADTLEKVDRFLISKISDEL